MGIMHEVSRTLSHPDTLHDISLCHLGELHVALPVSDVGDPIVHPVTQCLNDPDRYHSRCHKVVPHIHHLPQMLLGIAGNNEKYLHNPTICNINMVDPHY